MSACPTAGTADWGGGNRMRVSEGGVTRGEDPFSSPAFPVGSLRRFGSAAARRGGQVTTIGFKIGAGCPEDQVYPPAPCPARSRRAAPLFPDRPPKVVSHLRRVLETSVTWEARFHGLTGISQVLHPNRRRRPGVTKRDTTESGQPRGRLSRLRSVTLVGALLTAGTADWGGETDAR